MAPAAKNSNVSPLRKIRYAVVGIGHIAQTAVLPAFKNAAGNSELAAIVTGDPEKADVLPTKYPGVTAFSYEEYEKLLGSGMIDAVYISLPNRLHFEFAKKALQHRIHVLCEKPITLRHEEALELGRIAAENHCKLMVAYRLHFEVANLKAIEIARSGELGDLRYYSSVFSYRLIDPTNIRVRKDDGGGPIWDIGIYCINAARYLLSDEPIAVTAFATSQNLKIFSEVPETVAVSLKMSRGTLAQFTCSFGAGDIAEYKLFGTKGHLHLDQAFEYTESRDLRVVKDGKKTVLQYKKSDQFGAELVYFSDCLILNKDPQPSAREGAQDVRIIEAINESIRFARTVELQPHLTAEVWPSMKLRIYKPPVTKVETINARSPHRG